MPNDDTTKNEQQSVKTYTQAEYDEALRRAEEAAAKYAGVESAFGARLQAAQEERDEALAARQELETAMAEVKQEYAAAKTEWEFGRTMSGAGIENPEVRELIRARYSSAKDEERAEGFGTWFERYAEKHATLLAAFVPAGASGPEPKKKAVVDTTKQSQQGTQLAGELTVASIMAMPIEELRKTLSK